MSNVNQNGASSESSPLNVLGSTLQLFSRQPMTGFYRDGYCRVGEQDGGNHSVAGIVTDSFLDFSANRGNNLRSVGLTDGCKWCLCASRWQEAFDAFKRGEVGKEVVPKVQLDATHDTALRKLSINDLKEFDASK